MTAGLNAIFADIAELHGLTPCRVEECQNDHDDGQSHPATNTMVYGNGRIIKLCEACADRDFDEPYRPKNPRGTFTGGK